MKLKGALDRSRLVGALALQTYDAVTGMPSQAPCTVAAQRSSDLRQVQLAIDHPSGIRGFLVLRPGGYRIVVTPSGDDLLASAHAVTIAAPPPPPALPSPAPLLAAYLRPSSKYAPPAHS